MELDELQGEMNMMFSELLLASTERQITILLLMADLTKGLNSRIGMQISKLVNSVGEDITTMTKAETPTLKAVE
jgi:hypothetical protein